MTRNQYQIVSTKEMKRAAHSRLIEYFPNKMSSNFVAVEDCSLGRIEAQSGLWSEATVEIA